MQFTDIKYIHIAVQPPPLFPFRKRFIISNKNSVLPKQQLLTSRLSRNLGLCSIFCLYKFACFGTSYKRNYIMFVILSLAYFS